MQKSSPITLSASPQPVLWRIPMYITHYSIKHHSACLAAAMINFSVLLPWRSGWVHLCVWGWETTAPESLDSTNPKASSQSLKYSSRFQPPVLEVCISLMCHCLWKAMGTWGLCSGDKLSPSKHGVPPSTGCVHTARREEQQCLLKTKFVPNEQCSQSYCLIWAWIDCKTNPPRKSPVFRVSSRREPAARTSTTHTVESLLCCHQITP